MAAPLKRQHIGTVISFGPSWGTNLIPACTTSMNWSPSHSTWTIWLKRRKGCGRPGPPQDIAPTGRRAHCGAWDLAVDGELEKLLEELLADLPKNGLQTEIGLLYGYAGDLDRAFAHLNEAFAHHPTSLRYLSLDPRANSLRDDARFDELLKKLGNLGCGDPV